MDPTFSAYYETMMRTRRLLKKREDRFASLYASLQVMVHSPDGQRTPGPARGFCEAATAIGAHVIIDDGGSSPAE